MKEVSKVSNTVAPAPSPNNTYFRDTDLAKKYDVSRVTIWRWVSHGTFPQPVKLSPGCTRWYGPSVDAWDAKQLMA